MDLTHIEAKRSDKCFIFSTADRKPFKPRPVAHIGLTNFRETNSSPITALLWLIIKNLNQTLLYSIRQKKCVTIPKIAAFPPAVPGSATQIFYFEMVYLHSRIHLQ
jgi:hypothetical protein